MQQKPHLQVSTFFSLFAEFGTTEIPLELLAEKYFGLSVPQAKRKANYHQLPVPAYRTGGQKTGWLVSANVLADHIDAQRNAAKSEWEKANH